MRVPRLQMQFQHLGLLLHSHRGTEGCQLLAETFSGRRMWIETGQYKRLLAVAVEGGMMVAVQGRTIRVATQQHQIRGLDGWTNTTVV